MRGGRGLGNLAEGRLLAVRRSSGPRRRTTRASLPHSSGCCAYDGVDASSGPGSRGGRGVRGRASQGSVSPQPTSPSSIPKWRASAGRLCARRRQRAAGSVRKCVPSVHGIACVSTSAVLGDLAVTCCRHVVPAGTLRVGGMSEEPAVVGSDGAVNLAVPPETEDLGSAESMAAAPAPHEPGQTELVVGAIGGTSRLGVICSPDQPSGSRARSRATHHSNLGWRETLPDRDSSAALRCARWRRPGGDNRS